MTRYVQYYKIIDSCNLENAETLNAAIASHVENSDWEPFGPPSVVSHNGQLCILQGMAVFGDYKPAFGDDTNGV
jgi:hypothetical protein